MDPFSIAGLGLEAFGFGKTLITWIMKKAGKKLRILPFDVKNEGKHWVSTYIVVQNKSNDPLFDVQIACWLAAGQEIKIKPKHMQQMQDVNEEVEMDTAFYIIDGAVKDHPIKLLMFSRIMPMESFEIEVQLHRKGTTKFIPLGYSEDRPSVIQRPEKGGIAVPFKPPFEMTLNGVGLWLQGKSV